MSDRWLDLGNTTYFLPINDREKWWVERRGAGRWAAVFDDGVHEFKTKPEAMQFMEVSYELIK